MDVDQTYRDDNFTIYMNIKSPCTPEINIICQLYLNFKTRFSMKIKTDRLQIQRLNKQRNSLTHI